MVFTQWQATERARIAGLEERFARLPAAQHEERRQLAAQIADSLRFLSMKVRSAELCDGLDRLARRWERTERREYDAVCSRAD